MKSSLKKISKIILLLTVTGSSLFAQKADDVQVGNLLVSKIKVDGNTNDWTTPLKAINKTTGLSYTIANDAKNLYVVMQAVNVNDTRKILMGGITFSINEDGKKKTKEALVLTYPVITRNSRRAAFGGAGGAGGAARMGASFQNMTAEQRDSMQLSFGKRQIEAAKDIKIFGFKNITDTLVSIYNEYSIKAIASLNDKGIYTYEIAIPLELIPVDVNKEFGYNIKLNGLQLNFGGGENRPGGGGGGQVTAIRVQGGGGGFGGQAGGGNVEFQNLLSPTDFWGKYTIAK
ncbi:hypothetical protein [Pedobacter alpinus]|uniref:Uncharacterized protein n=1 Tax=Pedobacter alpinus TaxID=1590643 RepID=A0ABW5TTY7_9SPHI